MNLSSTPILANGMIMFDVLAAWIAPMLVAFILALVAVILASTHRPRKAPRWLSLVALLVSLGPWAVLLWYYEPVITYRRASSVLVLVSLSPIGMSALAIWLSRRALPGK